MFSQEQVKRVVKEIASGFNISKEYEPTRKSVEFLRRDGRKMLAELSCQQHVITLHANGLGEFIHNDVRYSSSKDLTEMIRLKLRAGKIEPSFKGYYTINYKGKPLRIPKLDGLPSPLHMKGILIQRLSDALQQEEEQNELVDVLNSYHLLHKKTTVMTDIQKRMSDLLKQDDIYDSINAWKLEVMLDRNSICQYTLLFHTESQKIKNHVEQVFTSCFKEKA